MRPTPARFIEVAFGHLLERVAPTLSGSYAQSDMTVLGALLLGLGEEFERAAARRIEENREIRRIFALAAKTLGGSDGLGDGELVARLASAAAGEDTDFSVSALEAANVRLRGLLIELHERVETVESAPARDIEKQIWRELAASTERRKLSFGPF